MADYLTTDITFPSNGGTATGYLARPSDGKPHPGIIVIQEWWGVNANIKAIAQRFAEAGFIALAPDLYHGKVIDEPNEAQKAAMLLDQAEVANDLRGALTALQGYSDVAPKKLGVTGFCLGGLITLVFAAQAGPELGAIAPFYPGGYDPTEDDVRRIQCPIQLVYGERDHSSPEATRERLRKYLTDTGKTFDMIVYPGADHAFFNDTRAEVYDAAAAEDAWNRTVSWFTRYLR
ncbi:MAG: dienelactone hydrolase family protein [Ktedonobacterales bacterium]|nr:dienelactone hydrolase family protein [Ktedonobacterales bacterium]